MRGFLRNVLKNSASNGFGFGGRKDRALVLGFSIFTQMDAHEEGLAPARGYA